MSAQDGSTQPAGAESLNQVRETAPTHRGAAGDLRAGGTAIEQQQGLRPLAYAPVSGRVLANNRGEKRLFCRKAREAQSLQQRLRGLKDELFHGDDVSYHIVLIGFIRHFNSY